MTQLSRPSKRLKRSRTEKMLAGVCGGLANYFGMDPTWMRLLFIGCLLLGGSTILVYIILWLIVPQEFLE